MGAFCPCDIGRRFPSNWDFWFDSRVHSLTHFYRLLVAQNKYLASDHFIRVTRSDTSIRPPILWSHLNSYMQYILLDTSCISLCIFDEMCASFLMVTAHPALHQIDLLVRLLSIDLPPVKILYLLLPKSPQHFFISPLIFLMWPPLSVPLLLKTHYYCCCFVFAIHFPCITYECLENPEMGAKVAIIAQFIRLILFDH